MKTIATLGTILIFTQISLAQENKLWVSLSAGLSNTTASNKSHLIGNGYNIEGNAFVPFYRKGWDGSVKGSGFMLGVNVSGNYANLKNLSPNNSNIQNEYKVFGGSLAVGSQLNSKTSASLSGLLGLQAQFSFGKFNVAPSLNTGYLSFKKEGYVQTGSVSINGQNRDIDLVKVDAQTTNGLIFKPQVKVGYNVTPTIALFVSPAMLMGHELTHTVQQRVPQGGFNDRKTYEADQLAKGTWESNTSTSKYNFSELNFGLSVALGKKKSKVKSTGLGSGGGAVSSSYAKTTAASGNSTVNSQKSEAQDFNTTRNNKERGQLATNPTDDHGGATGGVVNKQSQGQNFGEKVASGLQSGAGALSQGASLLGGALGGNFQTASNPMQPQGKGINEAGIKRTENAMAKPGSPIGGIVVKGGKNPGGQMRMVSNGNGEILLNDLQKGSYLFQLNDSVGKSINEKGVKTTGNAKAAPGNPIGGIIVKGGKNPGGNYINLTVNDKGQIGFDVLEKGNYKLIIQNPEPQKANGGNEKKVVEKATSGLKDTLKTNV